MNKPGKAEKWVMFGMVVVGIVMLMNALLFGYRSYKMHQIEKSYHSSFEMMFEKGAELVRYKNLGAFYGWCSREEMEKALRDLELPYVPEVQECTVDEIFD